MLLIYACLPSHPCTSCPIHMSVIAGLHVHHCWFAHLSLLVGTSVNAGLHVHHCQFTCPIICTFHCHMFALPVPCPSLPALLSCYDHILVYLPDGFHVGHQCVMIPRTYNWVAVLEVMNKNIGCEVVPLKPELSWKFEGTRSRILGLSTSSHWDNILLEVDAQCHESYIYRHH